MSELPVNYLITVNQAIAVIDAEPVVTTSEFALVSMALGRTLSEDVLTDRDYPPFDKILMDGFAVRCADVTTSPTTLTCVGEIAAGQRMDAELRPGEAVAIMTGAPLPLGADGIIPVEDTLREGNRVVMSRVAVPGKFIARKGSDRAKGDVVLRRGQELHAAQLAVAATVGPTTLRGLPVYAAPNIAILATGDEIVPFGGRGQIEPEQMRNASGIMLRALVSWFSSIRNLYVGHATDDPVAIRSAIERGLESDVLLITGGMSMGTHDHVPAILESFGADIKIRKLRIQPGKPFLFATIKKESSANPTYVFGLPGNPVSAYVCTLRLVSRLLTRLNGGEPSNPLRPAILTASLKQNGPREFYQPAIFDGRTVEPLAWRGSADVFTLAAANALLVRPENDPERPAGDVVDIIELPR